jgi:dihydropteroate synthase
MFTWRIRERVLEIGPRPLVMGIVNVTPDSFSDGGAFFDPDRAIVQAVKLANEGADILDIGGESSRPGSASISEKDEIERVVPVIEAITDEIETPISIDTMKAGVARAAVEAGASIINDVSGFRDPAMIHVAVKAKAGVIVMHMQGTPASMQKNPKYEDVVREIGEFFDERIATLTAAGVDREAICLDPGIGFGKTQEHNLQLLAGMGEYQRFQRPVCLGVSRKGFIGVICTRPVEERLAGSLAVASIAAARGEAHVLRVHDVAATRDAMLMLDAIERARRSPAPPGRITS